MRSLVFSGPGQVGWQDVPDPPDPTATGAVVRPLAVARCDLDQPMAAFGIFPGPFTVGHEAVVEVVAVGDEVRSHRVGDRVSVPFQVSCGECVPCRGSRFAACSAYRAPAGAAFGFGERGGGHGGAASDLLAVPAADHLLLAAPATLSNEALCTLPDNVLDAYRAVGPPLLERPGADVLIVGAAGPSIGLYAVHLAVALGASTVSYADTDPDRCAAAETLGAVVHHVEEWPRRFDRAAIVVENSGTPDGLTCALRSTDDYGTCTTVAINFAPAVPVPLLEMYSRGVRLVVSRADSRLHLATVLSLAADGTIDPLLVPHTVSTGTARTKPGSPHTPRSSSAAASGRHLRRAGKGSDVCVQRRRAVRLGRWLRCRCCARPLDVVRRRQRAPHGRRPVPVPPRDGARPRTATPPARVDPPQRRGSRALSEG